MRQLSSWLEHEVSARMLTWRGRKCGASDDRLAEAVAAEYDIPPLAPNVVVFVDSNSIALPITCYQPT
jgi:hypothetical protein